MAAEKAIFESQTEVHDLPPIFHYWSNAHLRPVLERFGFSNPDEFFQKHVHSVIEASKAPNARILSIGSGNCDLEVRLATYLNSCGVSNFTIQCLDVNEVMFERARALSESAGVSDRLDYLAADFNTVELAGSYDCVIANQSLHHVVELEHLFDEVARTLKPTGNFLIADMIGRNGHQRWPEALKVVTEVWETLDSKFKYNNQFRRLEEKYINWDYSGTGFEGIRSQDILEELLRRFSFELFVGFGGVVDVFVDRSFGPNFDPNVEADREFIDRMQEIEQDLIRSGTLTPTHMFAIVRRKGLVRNCTSWQGLSPESSVRRAH